MFWRYQMIVAFPIPEQRGDTVFERVYALAAWINAALGEDPLAELDGAVFFDGEAAGFAILTDSYLDAYAAIRPLIELHGPTTGYRVGYRDLGEHGYAQRERLPISPLYEAPGTEPAHDSSPVEAEWTYQLVFQFPWRNDPALERFDQLVALENRLEAILDGGVLGEVDGHDSGSGEFNIFIHTDAPGPVFEQLRAQLEMVAPRAYRVGFRKFNEDRYTVLWPKELSTFDVV